MGEVAITFGVGTHTMDAIRQTYFAMMDEVRRAQGDALGGYGLGPAECGYRVLASGPHWRLRAYGWSDRSASVLIVAAPVKRPYIWDLEPTRSAIRFCLGQRLSVYLIEWKPATPDHAASGLDEYADRAISECVGRSRDDARGTKPFLMGHSLGGTLAAIHAALYPQMLQGLVLLGAPLCFERGVSRFGDALVSILPSTPFDTDPVPGSLLSQVSALASPGIFVGERFVGAVLSIADPSALAISARVERWALDEVPLPGRLVQQIVQCLYREDRFCRGTLRIGGGQVGPQSLRLPLLAVVNAADEIAPPASATRFADKITTGNVRIVTYPGEHGVGLQHLALLVGRNAFDHVWPDVVSWIKAPR